MSDGMDKTFAGGGTGKVHAGAGSDFANAETGDDEVFGGNGNDTIQGRMDLDELHGAGGGDALNGGFRDGAGDKAFGGEGNDSYIWSSGDGNDEFHGGNGDEFHGGNGQDTLFLHDWNLEAFRNATQLYKPGLRILLVSDGTTSFTNQCGSRCPSAGRSPWAARP